MSGASRVAQMVKHLPAMQETWVQSLGQEEPLEKEWQPTPVFWPGISHGQNTGVGCHFLLHCIKVKSLSRD